MVGALLAAADAVVVAAVAMAASLLGPVLSVVPGGRAATLTRGSGGVIPRRNRRDDWFVDGVGLPRAEQAAADLHPFPAVARWAGRLGVLVSGEEGFRGTAFTR